MSKDFEAKAAHLIVAGEGSIPHMYLDVVGKVTVGVGNMLPDVDAAIELGFVYADSEETATDGDIAAEFETVLAQEKGRVASYYRSFTRLILPESEIDILLQKRLRQFERRLQVDFPDYGGYPEAARLGLIDMAFNLGNFGLVSKFPSFTKAARAGDWETCAIECRRKQIQDGRNAEVKNLFLSCVPPKKPKKRGRRRRTSQ